MYIQLSGIPNQQTLRLLRLQAPESLHIIVRGEACYTLLDGDPVLGATWYIETREIQARGLQVLLTKPKVHALSTTDYANLLLNNTIINI